MSKEMKKGQNRKGGREIAQTICIPMNWKPGCCSRRMKRCSKWSKSCSSLLHHEARAAAAAAAVLVVVEEEVAQGVQRCSTQRLCSCSKLFLLPLREAAEAEGLPRAGEEVVEVALPQTVAVVVVAAAE